MTVSSQLAFPSRLLLGTMASLPITTPPITRSAIARRPVPIASNEPPRIRVVDGTQVVCTGATARYVAISPIAAQPVSPPHFATQSPTSASPSRLSQVVAPRRESLPSEGGLRVLLTGSDTRWLP